MTRRASYPRRLVESAAVAAAVLVITFCAATLYVATVFGHNPASVARVFLSEAWHVNIPLFALAMLVAFNADGAE